MNKPTLTSSAIANGLERDGFALLSDVLSENECVDLANLFESDSLFRSTVNLVRHQFGVGTYRYFAYPLPSLIEELRQVFYDLLQPIASRWAAEIGLKTTYPPTLAEFLAMCRNAGQTQPTPLLLSYTEGGRNELHQDNYGKVAFPLQVLLQLTSPGVDFTGGEFLLREERSHARDIRTVRINPSQGDVVVFPNRWRPDPATGTHRRPVVKHGVSDVTSGFRKTLGIIFHDAR